MDDVGNLVSAAVHHIYIAPVREQIPMRCAIRLEQSFHFYCRISQVRRSELAGPIEFLLLRALYLQTEKGNGRCKGHEFF